MENGKWRMENGECLRNSLNKAVNKRNNAVIIH